MSDDTNDPTVSTDLGAINPLGIAPMAYVQPAQPTPNPLTSPAGRGIIAYAHNPTPTGNVGNDVPSWPFKVAKGVNVASLNPSFSTKMQRMLADAKAAGVTATVLSGYRDTDLQRKLYANYQAKQKGQSLPYPEEGNGGIAAPPGGSAHESGYAMDVAGASSKDQQWLIDNAPKYGIYPGANFGDPPHFQDADWKGNGGGSSAPGAPTNLASGGGNVPLHPEVSNALASSDTPQPGAQPDMYKNLMTMAMLQAIAPMHKFTPVSYDPFAVMPHVQGVGN